MEPMGREREKGSLRSWLLQIPEVSPFGFVLQCQSCPLAVADLPLGSIVVPSCDPKYKPQSGVKMEPVGKP